MKFSVKLFEVVRDPDPKSRMVMHQGKPTPADLVPKELPSSFDVSARNHDAAKREAAKVLASQKRSIRAMSFSALHKQTILAYVFKE